QPDYKKLEKDIAYTSMLSFYDRYAKISDIYKNETYDISKGNRLFTKAILEMNNDKVFYPNANGTMRLTYGKVTDYTSGLSIKYPFYSTLDEMMLKEVNKPNSDLIIPDRLKELYKNKDYGKYASDSTLNLCFITDNDIIGGMSGAPVINGTGEIIGIMFDINWEATSSDLFFDEQYQRSIAVDIRYVLFIIDKYAEASNIMNELTYTE
ncbi:MAG TPA: S46 family peptidase, partial [Bacteroidales bacterium]|nr:S46 family peptidase [Bacteroidales bacterium]